MGQIESGLHRSCTVLMARLLLAGLLGLALVLLTVADGDESQSQDKAISGHDIDSLERHRRSADPAKNGRKKSVAKTRNKEQKKGGQTKKKGQKSSKGQIKKRKAEEMAKQRRKQRRSVGRTNRECRKNKKDKNA